MKKGVKDLLDGFFGKTPKQKYRRLVYLICLIGLLIMLSLNIEFGITEKGKFYFKWAPAAQIEIKKGE